MSQGRQELALLDVDDRTGRASRQQQVGLTGEESRDLKHVHHLGDGYTLSSIMHVAQDRAADLAAYLGQAFKPTLHAQPALARQRGAVCLVVGCLEDQRDAARGAQLGQRSGDVERVLHPLGLAGARDQGERQGVGDPRGSDSDGLCWRSGHGCLLANRYFRALISWRKECDVKPETPPEGKAGVACDFGSPSRPRAPMFPG
jgi:hypothetical protein